MGAEELLEGICCLPCVVVGHAGRGVVGDVGLADTVPDVTADEAKVTVNGGKGTTGESPLLLRVMGEERVGVLEEGDEDEVVVDTEVGDNVEKEDLEGRAHLAPHNKTANDEEETNVRDNNVPELALLEDDRGGLEVVGPCGVVLLARGVHDEVKRPAEELVEDEVVERGNGGLAEGLGKLSLAPGGDVDTRLVLLDLLGWVAELLTGAGNKHLVTGKVTSGGVVTAVRDTPRVVWDENERVEDPTDSVVDCLGRRVGLVTTLVCNDPDTGEEVGLHDPVADPESGTGKLEGSVAQVEAAEERLDVESTVAESGNGDKVLDDILGRLESGTLVAVSSGTVSYMLNKWLKMPL